MIYLCLAIMRMFPARKIRNSKQARMERGRMNQADQTGKTGKVIQANQEGVSPDEVLKEIKERPTRRWNWARRVLLALLAVVLVALAGMGVWLADYYHADGVYDRVAQQAVSLEVAQNKSEIVVGDRKAQTGIVFYPGAKVDPAAYMPLMLRLAKQGYYCVIVKMPVNLVVLKAGAADSVIARHRSVSRWWIAGHSMGGAMAAQYASKHTDQLQGVILLAAYSTQDISRTKLAVLTIYGSKDGVLNRAHLAKYKKNLPVTSQQAVEIPGGNHARFGDYGLQKGDGTATISRANQQSQTAAAIVGFIREHQVTNGR